MAKSTLIKVFAFWKMKKTTLNRSFKLFSIGVLLAALSETVASEGTKTARDILFQGTEKKLADCKALKSDAFKNCVAANASKDGFSKIFENVYKNRELITAEDIVAITQAIEGSNINEQRKFKAWALGNFGDRKAKEHSLKIYKELSDSELQAGTNAYSLLISLHPDDSEEIMEAVSYLDKSRKLGHRRASYLYAVHLIKGVGVKQDVDSGLKMINELAEEGYAPAISFIARFVESS